MGIITFVTPPGRPSVLRASTIQEVRAQHADATATQELNVQASALRPTNSEPAPAQDADQQLVEHQPLTFHKRILPQLTTSPEPAAESFDLPRSRKSLDEAHVAGESKRPSLLSTAISANPPRSASTTNLGILRRAESENARASLDGGSRATGDASDATTSAPRPRLQFIEPHKQLVSHVSARPDSRSESDATTSKSTIAPALASTSTAATQHAAEPEAAAPRKRSLVIQEHADVLERAAERAAARQANHLSCQALEQHSRASTSSRSRQHSASSAGDETASTRSSWALRSSSRGSSIGTSPSVVSDDNAQEPLELEPLKASEPPIVSIFSNATASDKVDAARLQPAPPNPPRKLTFISPAPSKRRRSPETKPVSPGRRESDHDLPPGSSRNVGALSDGDAQARNDAPRRVLAFAACPKPQRAARLSPAHATRKPKSKLSASPAPHKLAYPQRLRGIRGGDPIRSPAPDKARITSTQAAKWDELLEHVSSEGSGYSEDEEDGDDSEEDDDDNEDEDALSGSSRSDSQSLTDSLEKSQNSHASSSWPDAVEQLREQAMGEREQQAQQLAPQTDRHQATPLLSDSEPGSSRHASSRRSSGAARTDPHFAARSSFASQTSPPRLAQPSLRSTQTSPLSGLAGRSSRKLVPKESFSHPMCFLPDAFEDSAPPTPTEPDSDAFEASQRANLLSGWLSEGGSAASSRRASWQQPAPTGPRGQGEGREELAVPIALPPFRRARERTAQQGVMSDGEQSSSRSLGGNAAFIRVSAGFGRAEGEMMEQRSGGVSPRGASQHALGVSVPLQARPGKPVSWRHVSSQHVATVERPGAAAVGYRRASHSMEPRKSGAGVSSPIGSYSFAAAGGRVSQAAGLERPFRPSVGKQRAVSTSSHIRSCASVAPSMHDEVVVATSPPRDDASRLLKHHLAHSPKSGGAIEGQRSGSTTPGLGWMSDGQLPGQGASRYWSERLSSLAHVVSEELSLVGGAVLGKDKVEGEAEHRRAQSVPLEAAEGSGGEVVPQQPVTAEAGARRNSVGVPVPIKPAVEWSAHRDGQGQTQPRRREVDADPEDESKPFQFATRHIDTDGSTRMVVIHTSSNAHAAEG